MEALSRQRVLNRLIVSKARDGDGDGFIYDGTPRQRPAPRIPGRVGSASFDIHRRRRGRPNKKLMRELRDQAQASSQHDIDQGTPGFRNDPGEKKDRLEMNMHIDNPIEYARSRKPDKERKIEGAYPADPIERRATLKWAQGVGWKRSTTTTEDILTRSGKGGTVRITVPKSGRSILITMIDREGNERSQQYGKLQPALERGGNFLEFGKSEELSKRRGRTGWARFQPGPDDPMKYKIPNPKSTPKEIVGSHGHRPHGKSILWPALYEHLRAKGYTKAKAAAISNAGWKKKRMGIPTNTPTSARGLAKSMLHKYGVD